eukprot:2229292-Pleurochrysis_carterae.AAC.1
MKVSCEGCDSERGTMWRASLEEMWFRTGVNLLRCVPSSRCLRRLVLRGLRLRDARVQVARQRGAARAAAHDVAQGGARAVNDVARAVNDAHAL